MNDAELQALAEEMYDIEVETSEAGFITYELVTKTGGAVRDDQVDGRNKAADMGFNSKDYNFLPVIASMGLGPLLKKKVEEQKTKEAE